MKERNIISKYKGRCAKCGKATQRGELITWIARGVVMHPECASIDERHCITDIDMQYEDDCARACGLI